MNNLVRPRQWQSPAPASGAPAIGQRDRSGSFVWTGATWVPAPCDCDDTPGFPCPPPGFPPPGCPPWYAGANSPPWYPGANAGVSFGATPPPNPVRGHFWWDGQTMWLFDGAAWSGIGGPGTGANAYVGSSPPPNPQVGALWFDGNALLVWNGVMWGVAGGGTSTGSTPPANPQPGQQWFDGVTLWIWDGNAWVPTSQTKSYVQPTAPGSPNPGDTWWDGSQMRIWDGHAWETVGPGSFVGPVGTTTKVFQLTMASPNLSIPAATWTPVPFVSSPQVDTSNGWDPTSHKYTPQKAGMYWFFVNHFYVGGSGNPAAGSALLFNDNGSFLQQSQNYVISLFQDGVTQNTMTGDGVVHMNGTTDFVRLWGFGNDGKFYQSSPTQPTIVGLILP